MVLHSLSATGNPEKPLKLTIWEPAKVNGDRIRPFYFKANYICETLPEAKQILSDFKHNSRDLQTA
ncbi:MULTISPECIES: hypothetical protein [unclassified Coleofasciculus]|uniref:hypothetical protein n=1 Tax=unclassified Coleofasciculus TaxID=2692782 RepID=UPI00188092F3|nr:MULTISPECIES: hypothetical protein [unclassified Coleofasciculus]MBE9129137.1 hypothetical protein [Coleofasciculus sp. LEGE 07081]MBE9149516.1 hypothetical protein [Coleofasciculus sp. LEGE 07092]